jgi:CubicO group peptidase (beta-lactamase class C family)
MMGSLDRLIAAADAHDISIHSIEVSRDGSLVYSAGAEGMGPQTPHRFYSVSKTFTAIAVLSLADEGKLATSDRLMDHFPEKRPVHPLLELATIDDLLSMRSPYTGTTYTESSPEWLESFFRTMPSHRPGTLFHYDTSASYVLAALVERIEGMSWERVLRARVFAPLGLGEDMRMITSPEGIAHGGSGMVARPHDLLVIGEMLLGGGERDGVRVLPRNVVDELVRRRADTGMLAWGSANRFGYAAQTWLPPQGGWMMVGLGGQYVYGDPARGLVAVMTANAQGCNAGDNRLSTLLLEALDEPLGDAPTSIAWPAPPHDPSLAREACGSVRAVSGSGLRSRIALDLAADRVMFDGVEIAFDVTAGEECPIDVPGVGHGIVTGGWCAPGIFDARIDVIGDDIARQRVRIVVTDDGLITIQAQGFGPGAPDSWTGQGTFQL